MGWAHLTIALQPSDLNWYVARIKSGLTSKAIEQLDNADFENSYPTYVENKKQMPLVPGYIFIRMPHDTFEFAAVNALSAIEKLLPFSVNPCPVPKKWMQDFQRQLSNGEFDIEVEDDGRLPWFNKNEILMVTSGPFMGHTGTFVRVAKGAVVVNLQFFGRGMEVPIKGHQVQRMM